jgi:hypothetical protein
MRERHPEAVKRMRDGHAAARHALKTRFLNEARRIRADRYLNRPTGLAAFLGRITGIQLLIRKIQKYRNRKRFKTFLEEKGTLQMAQRQDQQGLQRHHEMQALDMDRRFRALDQVDQRERASLETALNKERRVRSRARGGHENMPALTLS